MDQKKSNMNKVNSSISSSNLQNSFINKSINTVNQLKANSNILENKIYVSKQAQNQRNMNSPIRTIIKEKKNNVKNELLTNKTSNNSNINLNKNINENNKKNKITKNIKNKFTRTFSGCGRKRKCSLNNKGTFNIMDTRMKKISFNSKEKGKIYLGNSVLSSDVEIIQEFNSTNINNYSNKKKNNRYNTMITMTNYQFKESDKYIKKINNEENKIIKKKNLIKKNSKQKDSKSNHYLKNKEEISINDNKAEIHKNSSKKNDKDKGKNTNEKKSLKKNKEEIIINNINNTIDNNHNEKKIIKIHIIDGFKQKRLNNKRIKIEDKEEYKNRINNSVDNKNSKKQNINNIIKSKEINSNYFSYNPINEMSNVENKIKIYKINSCLKKSKNIIINLHQKSNSTIKNNIRNINQLPNSRKSKNNNNELNIISNNSNSKRKGTLNLRTMSNNQNLKNNNNSCKNYLKINNYNNYFSNNYTTMTNRIKLALNMVFYKNNYNNVKYSLIRNIKNHIAEDNNFNNNLLFILNILSNWGNKKQIGITGIEIFDINNQKIKIKECKVEGGSNEHIDRLFNDKIYTINENDMWLTDINYNNNNNNKNFLNLKLYFYISNYISLESINNINIYNYNGWELNKSIKKIEILTKDEDAIFNGIIPKGEYNIKCFHPYIIRINKKILLKRNKNKIYKNTHLLYNTYKHEMESSFDLNYISCNNSLISKKSKIKKDIKNIYNPIMKHSSMNDSKKFNRYNNIIKVKSSRSKKKNKNQYYSFINNEYKRRDNNSESKSKYKKNKKFMANKIKSIEKIKNNSFIFDKKNKKISNYDKPRGSCEILKKEKNLNCQKYSLTTIKIEKNNSLINIKSFDSFNTHKFNNYQTINDSYNNDNIKKNISNFLTNNNTISSNSKQIESPKNILKYIFFKKIRINILSNYGNSYVVGLTGINLIDKDNKEINIESAETVGAFPKDLKTIYNNENEDRIFENVFNGINNTINENFMWLTLLNPNPFIEISFKNKMTLNRIEIWNYNEPISLDKGVKDIEIIFDDNENKKYKIILWKGLGIDYYDYFQKIYFDKYEDILKINNSKLINNKTKNLPTGFVFKLIFISNYGDKVHISLKKFELYNEKNSILTNYTIINDNYNDNNIINNSSNNSLKSNNYDYIKNYFYYHQFFDFRKDEDSICNNLLFICFNEIVQIKYIKIENISNGKLRTTSTKSMQIYCDDLLIFEGELKNNGENIILFDEKEIKKFNNVININQKKTKYKFTEKIKGDVCTLINVGSCNE